MRKLYLFVFSNNIDPDSVTDFFDADARFNFWFMNLPQSIFVKTTLSASEINAIMITKFGDQNVMFTTEVTLSNYSGVLPTNHWQYFNN